MLNSRSHCLLSHCFFDICLHSVPFVPPCSQLYPCEFVIGTGPSSHHIHAGLFAYLHSTYLPALGWYYSVSGLLCLSKCFLNIVIVSDSTTSLIHGLLIVILFIYNKYIILVLLNHLKCGSLYSMLFLTNIVTQNCFDSLS